LRVAITPATVQPDTVSGVGQQTSDAVPGREVTASDRSRLATRPVAPGGWWWDALAIIALVVLTLVINAGHLLAFDLRVRDWCAAHGGLASIAVVFNYLGQGGFFTVVCGLLAVYWVWRRHSVRPLLPVIVAFVLSYVVLTVVKDITNRAAPKSPVAHPELFGSGGVSYPSGHLTNAFVWYGVLALLVAPWLTPRWRWFVRVAPPVILTVTTIYLRYHWFTDTAAGILVGFVLWRVIARVPWDDVPLGSWLARRDWDRPALYTHVR
jgi:membrane-associated phospholipid phosphatase